MSGGGKRTADMVFRDAADSIFVTNLESWPPTHEYFSLALYLSLLEMRLRERWKAGEKDR